MEYVVFASQVDRGRRRKAILDFDNLFSLGGLRIGVGFMFRSLVNICDIPGNKWHFFFYDLKILLMGMG